MKRIRRVWAVLLALVAGCATTTALRGPEDGVYYLPLAQSEMVKPPKSPSSVKVYKEGTKLPLRYFWVIGRIIVAMDRFDFDPWVAEFGGNTCTFVSIPRSTEPWAFKILQEEAAKRGGDAVIHVGYVEIKSEAQGEGYERPRIIRGFRGEVIIWEKAGKRS